MAERHSPRIVPPAPITVAIEEDDGPLIAYGVIAYLVQMVFWVITGLWGWRQTPLNLRELVKLKSFRSKPDPEQTGDEANEAQG